MSTAAVVVPSLRLGAADRERLAALGLSLVTANSTANAATESARKSARESAAKSARGSALSDAVLVAADAGVRVAVADRAGDARAWRRTGPDLIAAVAGACRDAAGIGPVVVVVLPASSAPRPGPVVVLSPAGSVSSYELYVGAALAAAANRRVEHVNGRGAAGSARRSGPPARAAARAAVPGWSERAAPRPEHALHGLVSRPSAVVVPVPPGSADAASIVADHPDADVALVFDVAHARHGAAVAEQVASLVELALGVETCTAAPPVAAPRTASALAARSGVAVPVAPPETGARGRDAAVDLPAFRASDVVHVRLTDTDLELTNRTRRRIGLHVGVGSTTAPHSRRAVFEALLDPGESRSAPTGPVAAVADLAPPTAVVRHGSHGSAVVYEGGDRRVLDVEVTVLDALGGPRPPRTYRALNGLDFSLVGRDLATLVGAAVARPVLPEPVPAAARARPPRDLWAALGRALAVGAGVLARPTS